MPVVQFPNDLVLQEVVGCSICQKDIPLDKATAGFIDTDNRQRFACNSHFWEGNKYITGWIDFAARERLRTLHAGMEPSGLRSIGGGNAWSLP